MTPEPEGNVALQGDVGGDEVRCCCRPARAWAWAPLLTMLPLLVVGAWLAWRQLHHAGMRQPSGLPHDLAARILENQSGARPCRGQPPSKQAGCQLLGNVVATRRQLQQCGFPAVVVVPLARVRSPQDANGTTLQSDYARFPYPVVLCTPKPGLPDHPDAFHASALDDAPCVRPGVGREDVAYVSFILQNFQHLPQHVFFMHGHEASWHQDRSATQLLGEFCGRQLPSSMYVSLGDRLSRDWRRGTCLLGLCKSAGRQRTLERAWREYFGYYLGPLPPDLQHFCCSQFVVSRARVLLRPLQLYRNLLAFSLQGVPGVYSAGAAAACWGECSLPSLVMEVLWPYVFGEGVPLAFDERLGLSYPVEQRLPSDTLRLYRYAWSTDEWLRGGLP